MNFRNLKQLQKLAKDIVILYIEDDKEFQKQVKKVLGKVFDSFYQAYDGREGYDLCKKIKPDIVITSLNTPLKSGLELIADLQDIDDNINIIILNNGDKELEFFKNMDFGISDILIKPLDIDKLMSSLISTISSLDQSCYQDGLELLEKYIKNKTNMTMLNIYKGTAIENKVTAEIKDDQITLFSNHMSSNAAMHQKYTILNIDSKNKYLKLFVLTANVKKGYITCVKPKAINDLPCEFLSNKIGVDKSFKSVMRYNSKSYDLKAIGAAKNSIELFSKKNIEILKGDTVDLTLGFDVKNNSMINKTDFGKVFTKGKVSNISPYKNGILIEFDIDVKKSDQRLYYKYLEDIKSDIFNELLL
ncbi:MAG: response regulator [Campylobacterota bacterium]|nr:response regulator [Campylobacterota bacterium]